MTKVPKKRRLCLLTLALLCSPFWISWPLKLGPIRFPNMSVMIYHSTLC